MRRDRRKSAKHILSLLLCLTLMLSMTPSLALAAGNEGAGDTGTESTQERYAPGEVIVMFKDGSFGGRA